VDSGELILGQTDGDLGPRHTSIIPLVSRCNKLLARPFSNPLTMPGHDGMDAGATLTDLAALVAQRLSNAGKGPWIHWAR
jgi:hypothetical protein